MYILRERKYVDIADNRAIRGGRKAEPTRLKAWTEIDLPGTHFNIDITTGRLEWKGGFHEMKGVLKMKEKNKRMWELGGMQGQEKWTWHEEDDGIAEHRRAVLS